MITPKSLNNNSIRWHVIGAVVCALAVAAPLFFSNGFLNTRSGGDSPFLLFRLHQLYVALAQGVFPVRWMQHGAFGLGYPFFNYYAALPFYLAALIKALGFSFVFSLKLTQTLGFIAAAVGMAVWTFHLTRRPGLALAAAAAYTFAPFHMVNVYVRGDSLAEFWAMACYPWILLALHAASEAPTPRRLAWVALSYGALLMTHNVSALIFTPFVAVYGLGCAWFSGADDRLKRTGLLAGAGVLGLLISAWVWLPALAESDLVQLEAQTTGFLFYGEHFRGVDLVQPRLTFSYRSLNEQITPFSMGFIQAAMCLLGAIPLVVRSARAGRWWPGGFLIGGLVLSTLMITPLSRPLWDVLPLLEYAQFPWRFLSVQALFTAAISGWLAPERLVPILPVQRGSPSEAALIRDWTAMAAVTLAAFSGLAALGDLRPEFVAIREGDITPRQLAWYEGFSGNIGTTIRHEYLPDTTEVRPYAGGVGAVFLQGEGTAVRITFEAHRQRWQAQVAEGPALIMLPLHYFPGWRARVDGFPARLGPAPGSGWAMLEVPAGIHTLDLRLARTPVRLGAEIASLLALTGLGIVILGEGVRLNARSAGWWAAAALTLWAVLRSADLQPAAAPLITADFGQEAYFHHSQVINYGPEVRLQAAQFSLQGNNIHYALDIKAGAGIRDQVRCSVILVPPPQQAEQGAPSITLLEQASLAAGECEAGQVPLPAQAVGGLYFPQLEISVDVGMGAPVSLQPQTPGGLTRGALHFEPLLVPNRPGQGDLWPDQADFGPLRLLDMNTQAAYQRVIARPRWGVLRAPGRTYAAGLRLFDAAGNLWAERDVQIGGVGLNPSVNWPRGQVIADAYRLDLPGGAPPGSYTLSISLYEPASLDQIGQARIEGVQYPYTSRAAPPDPQDALHGALHLHSIDLPMALQGGQPLSFSVDWVIAEAITEQYQVQWALSGPANWQAAPQALVPGSRPGTWQVQPGFGGLVEGRYRLDLPAELPEGEYELSLTLLDGRGHPLSTSQGLGRFTLEGARTFAVPPLAQPLEASFGGVIKLWGYSLQAGEDQLTLEVAWGALEQTSVDYMLFIHLFEPEGERIAAQVDTMPRGFTYPTSLWAAGEVITEQLVISLEGVPPGAYRLAVGWYDPATGVRLPALDAQGGPLPGERLVLPETIERN